MLKSDRIIALDIGASKVVLAEFLVAKSGEVTLLNYGIGGLDAGGDSSADNSAFVVSAIRDLMRQHNIRRAPLLMTISGQAVFPRYVKLPPVTGDKIKQIIRYEAEQNVPFPIDEVVWDYQLMEGDPGEMNIMLVAVKTETVSRLADCTQAAGLEPEVVDVAPMALYNMVRYNYPELSGCTMVLDIGAKTSNLIFIEGNRVFSRSIPVAGAAMTQELMKEFNLSFAEAEELKKKESFVAFGGSYARPEGEKADRVSKVVRNVVTRLHAEVNRSISFYRSQQGGRPPSLVLLTGGSSVIPHTDTFFRERLHATVEMINPFRKVAVSRHVPQERIVADYHLLGEVVGLALRRRLTCPIEINLLPPDLVQRKTFRKRQPYFAMSTAVVVVIMLCWWAYLYRMREAYSARDERIRGRIALLGKVSGSLAEMQKSKQAARERVDRIVDLIGTRTRWIDMLDGVHEVMPEGMWLTALQPVMKGGQIVQINISGRGFKDKLEDKPGETQEGTTIEKFRNRLVASRRFTEETKITKELPEDYARDFTIQLVLKDPISLE